MKRSRTRMLVFAGVGVLLFALFLVRRREESQIAYHLRKLDEAHRALTAPTSTFEAFRFDRIKYTLGARIPVDDFKKHHEALLRCGFFQNTNFSFPDTNIVRGFVMEIKKIEFRDTNWSYAILGTNVEVTAAASDLPLWETAASNVNARASKNTGAF